VVGADVAREEDVKAVLDTIARTLPPLRGVMHAAGVLDGGLAADLTLEQLREVMGPKVRGTRHLDALTADCPLDFFVLFSSAAAVLGSPGQANYAAANAFLDAMAQARHRAGRPALSVNWGFWAEAGMAARTAESGWTIPDGFETISPADGVEMLGRLMAETRPQVAVMPIDWGRLRQFAGPAADDPFVDELAVRAPGNGLARAGGLDLETLRTGSAEERQARLEEYLGLEVARVLQHSTALLERDRPLSMLGLDSLTGLVLKNRIEADLSLALPMTSLAAGPTIAELAAELSDLATGHHADVAAREGVR
jgi:NAD(P)-dependent dehydrogenase (short-subunit alcohol dehydrogenase family)